MQFPTRKSRPPAVQLTALIDIVFLLLIFFLLTSSVVNQQGIPIVVPEVDSESKELVPDLIVQIDEQGHFYFGTTKVSDVMLLAQLKKALSVEKKPNVAIQADRRVPYDRVANAIDISKKAGAKHFLLVTSKSNEM